MFVGAPTCPVTGARRPTRADGGTSARVRVDRGVRHFCHDVRPKSNIGAYALSVTKSCRNAVPRAIERTPRVEFSNKNRGRRNTSIARTRVTATNSHISG